MPSTPPDPETLQPWTPYRLSECGGVYTAEKDGMFYVISDESALAEMLPDEDLGPLVSVKTFETESKRAEYLRDRYTFRQQ